MVIYNYLSSYLVGVIYRLHLSVGNTINVGLSLPWRTFMLYDFLA